MATINVRKWAGSQATTMETEDLQPGDFRELVNWLYDQNGLPVVRGGRRIWNPGAGQVKVGSEEVTFNGMVHFRKGWIRRNQRDYVVVYGGYTPTVDELTGRVWYANPDGQFIEIYSGLPSKAPASWAVMRGWVVLALNSPDLRHPLWWNGDMPEMQELSRAPNGYLVAGHAGRLWMVTKEEPSTIHYSAPFEPNNWKTANGAGFLQVGVGDGNVISALVPGFAGEMIIFKDGPSGGSTYRLQGSSELNFSVKEHSSTLGAVSQQMAKLVGDRDIFFGSRRGLHSFRRVEQYGDLEASFLDIEVADKWRNLSDPQKLRAFSVDDYTTDTWWIFVDLDADDINDRGWLFNYRHKSARGNPRFSETDYGANSATVYRDPESGRNMLMTGGSDGYTRTEGHPEANDDGTDYNYSALLSPIDAGDSFKMKAWKTLWLQHDNWGVGDINVEWYGDNRRPSESTIELNPANLPTSFESRTQGGEFRGSPKGLPATSVVNLREGGVRLNVKISGTRGRTRLKSMRLTYETMRENVTAPDWSPYRTTRDEVIAE